MVQKKRASKRQTLKTKFNVEKKVRDHKRKQNKLARALPNGGKRKKEPGIPNLYPFKEELLDKYQKQKELEEQIRQDQKARRAEVLKQKRKAAAAVERQQDEETGFVADATADQRDLQRRRWYIQEMKKVIETSDVILEVLDARDPLGCRCHEVEAMIQKSAADGAQAKRVVLVLNKADLIPPAAVEQWVKYFNRELPTVAFKSMAQQPKINSKAKSKAAAKVVTKDPLADAIGTDGVLELLSTYSRLLSKKITVGVIGFPNVGKSSVVNSLRKVPVAVVDTKPGSTTAVQTVKLDKAVTVVDTPGVLFSAGTGDADLVLRNCLRVEQLENPEEAVSMIVDKVSVERLMEIYEIPLFKSVEQFLTLIAQKRDFKRGKEWNTGLAARKVIADWIDSKIPFYAMPPQQDGNAAAELKDQEVFPLIDGANSSVVNALRTVRDKPAVYAPVSSFGDAKIMTEEEAEALDAAEMAEADEDEDDEQEGDAEGDDEGDEEGDDEDEEAGEGDMSDEDSAPAAAAPKQQKQQQQQQQKKGASKQGATEARRPQTSASKPQSAAAARDSYDFATDFD